MRYIGFDLGDGESAVAVLEQGSGIEPVIRPVQGCKSILSAVGTLRGETVIGERAYTEALADNLSVRFKSRFTYDPASYDTVVRFVRAMLAELRESDGVGDNDLFVVGCPAGWNAACRARYRELLIKAGMREPNVISESRAAFLYAKYARTIALDLDILRQSALVIDMGSSTLDFAYIVDGRETGIGTFGDIQLGGGLLEAELLRRAVEKSREKEKIKAVFAECKSWYSYCEIEARRLKEQFFTQVAADPKASVKKQLRICYDGVQKLALELDAVSAGALVEEPLEALHGKSFSQALQDALENAVHLTSDQPPAIVLLTGGASKMPFFQEQCREIFESSIVVCCPEPEFSIAKGLAYAGWIDENMKAFRLAIATEVTEQSVTQIAREALPQLIPSVAEALRELILEEAAIPIANLWKQGQISTLKEMNERMSTRIERVMHSSLAEEALSPVITCWLQGLTGRLQAMIDPICDRYEVPRREMRLSFTQMGEGERLPIGGKELLGLGLAGTVVSTVIGIASGMLCGGGGIALIGAGPLGFLAGLVVGAIVAALGWNAVSGWLLKAKLPTPMRWMNVEKRLRGQSVQNKLRDALMQEIGAADGAFGKNVVHGFTDAFTKYLHQIAQAAEIPIQ